MNHGLLLRNLNYFNLKSYEFESRKWMRGDNNEEVPINHWEFHNFTIYHPSFPFLHDRMKFVMKNHGLIALASDTKGINTQKSFSICQNRNGEIIFSRTASKVKEYLWYNKATGVLVTSGCDKRIVTSKFLDVGDRIIMLLTFIFM